jgi:signal transduction histidine kinase
MLVWPPRIITKLSTSWFKIPISHRGILVIALQTLWTLVTLGLWVWSTHNTQTTIQQIMAIASLLSFLGAVYLFRQLEQERDLTDRVQADNQLKAQSYVAAHDLKTPLRGIATLSEWIEEDLGAQLPATNQQQLQLLRSRVHRLTTLINELLDYSRIGHNKNITEQVVVTDLLQDVIKSLAPPNHISILIGDNMPTFNTAKDLLQKVFYHLIENSILHHDLLKGTVKITAKESAQKYEFIITDDGPGIAPEYHQKVFTVFQILDRRDDTQQTGIGLAMVKKIVEITGGEVWLEGKGDRGLAVHFTWAKDNQI